MDPERGKVLVPSHLVGCGCVPGGAKLRGLVQLGGAKLSSDCQTRARINPEDPAPVILGVHVYKGTEIAGVRRWGSSTRTASRKLPTLLLLSLRGSNPRPIPLPNLVGG